MGTQQTGYMPRLGAINKWSKKVAYTATRHSVRWELTPILDEMALGTAVTTLQESLTQHIMVCLAKPAIGVTEEGEDVYDAAGTRPLAIVNTDNRILANAARARWEGIFADWISNMQKGFIRGRSMLSNVITIEQ